MCQCWRQHLKSNNMVSLAISFSILLLLLLTLAVLTFLFFKTIGFYFYLLFFEDLFVCMCVYRIGAKRGHMIPWSCRKLWVTPRGCWEPNLGSARTVSTLIFEPSLSPGQLELRGSCPPRAYPQRVLPVTRDPRPPSVYRAPSTIPEIHRD